MYKLRGLASTAATRGASIASRRHQRFVGSITYSGGQATEGQGGYYGSGGTRSLDMDQDSLRDGVLAMAEDVKNLVSFLGEVEKLESMLEKETEPTSSQSIEIKAGIKKLVTSPEVTEFLSRLEAEGEPVWGLSTEERELVMLAKEKVNAS